MEHHKNFSLKDYNTFGIDVSAKAFVSVSSVEELKEVLQQVYAHELFVLGGGSNILLLKNIDQTILHINLKGRVLEREDENYAYVRAQAGENWHEFVRWCIAHNFGGLENLSLIPGNVGTSPIQNIGAYGVELKDSFVSCEAIHKQTLQTKIFTKEECHFGYRNSTFKNENKDKFIITSVLFRLTKKQHQLHTGYGAILAELEKENVDNPSIEDVSDAVIAIRQSKLPNPKELGNSGSFFKNPIIPKLAFDKLVEKFPEMPSYPVSTNEIKIPAGWLIEKTGFKGCRREDAGVHKNQALVLVNYGKATGEDIYRLAQEIQKKIWDVFDIHLEMEVNVIK
ncbi:UDP-N-acetylmuramate dehydrogenase [Mesonia sp. MT50]|uniref:UDP-N-acetylenolpyruvoylglucosamine reductase n=1 Tax=Mesonia profundi TaxID=3070998 RepID=A0ABU0ZZK6_9FLAO|nr:UDP-N-acetylmuramate dehydrogenase [Mesonia profundi]MDQ7916892.1 UDP-N-acetylmuramate dehydrogenase [Mesonia profundi]